MSGSNVTNSEACMMALTWALLRMPPLKLFAVDLFPSEKLTVPEWSGFNAVVHSCVPVLSNIGYCPMIDGSPTEFWPMSAVMYCTFFLNVYIVLNSVGEPSISKKRQMLWRGLSSYRILILTYMCHYCHLQPVQTHTFIYLLKYIYTG